MLYKVHLLKNKSELYINQELLKLDSSSVIFITGLSGSGKTTLAKQLSCAIGIKYVSLDALRFYNISDDYSKFMVMEFARMHPNILGYINSQWNTGGYFNQRGEILYKKYCELFVNFIVDFSNKNKTKLLVEGIQLFVRLPYNCLSNKPIIVLRTSSFQCIIFKTKRDTYDEINIPKIIIEWFRYHVIQRYKLNKFIKHLNDKKGNYK